MSSDPFAINTRFSMVPGGNITNSLGWKGPSNILSQPGEPEQFGGAGALAGGTAGGVTGGVGGATLGSIGGAAAGAALGGPAGMAMGATLGGAAGGVGGATAGGLGGAYVGSKSTPFSKPEGPLKSIIGREKPKPLITLNYAQPETRPFNARSDLAPPIFDSPGAAEAAPQTEPPGGNPMLTNEDLAMIMSAIAETPQFQFLGQLMNSEEAAAIDPNAPEEAPAPALDGGMEDPGMEAPGMEAPPEMGMEAPPAPEMAPAPGEEPEQNFAPAAAALLAHPAVIGAGAGYLGGAVAGRKSNAASGQQPDRYSQLHAAHKSLVHDHGALAQRFEGLMREKSDAQRTAALQGLATKYPQFIDLDAELGATLYSQKAEVSDEQFASHVGQLTRYAQRAESMARQSRPDIPMGQVNRQVNQGPDDKYQMNLANEAVRIHGEAQSRGEVITYEDAKAKAAELLSQG